MTKICEDGMKWLDMCFIAKNQDCKIREAA